MRWLSLIATVLILAGGFYLASSGQAHKLLYYSQCDQPVPYRIDRVDSEFNLSVADFKTAVSRAVEIWDRAYGKPLFVYDPKSKLTVNLEFDKRQLLNDKIGQLGGELKAKESALTPQIANFESRVADFKIRLAAFDLQVDSWNDQGGAPPDEYAKLIAQRETLQVEAKSLNALASQLNLNTRTYNTEVGSLNRTIGELKTELEFRPEEGIYDPKQNAITIYFNITSDELVHTLAHEFGHALGLSHSQNQEAMMFFKTNRQLTLSPEDLTALKNVCRERSVLDSLGKLLGR